MFAGARSDFSWQDKPWAEFSTLEVAAFHAMHSLRSIALWPNLELKTRPKQLLDSLPLEIAIPGWGNLTWINQQWHGQSTYISCMWWRESTLNTIEILFNKTVHFVWVLENLNSLEGATSFGRTTILLLWLSHKSESWFLNKKIGNKSSLYEEW